MIKKVIACLCLAALIFCGVEAMRLSGVSLTFKPLSNESDELRGDGEATQAPRVALATAAPGTTATPLQPVARGSQSDETSVTLYFRYHLSSYLGREERAVSVPRDDAVELTIVQALIAGPSSTYQELNPLFPPDTQVVATRRSGNMVTVTLSRAFLGAPADAPQNWQSYDYWVQETVLRRRLAAQSIVSALTENGRCERVQILIAAAEGDIQGERIPRALLYADETDPHIALEPFARNEDVILTPRSAARAILSLWQSKSWDALYGFMSRGTAGGGDASLPAQTEFLSEVSTRACSLLGYSVGSGSVSVDGKRATVNVSLQIQRSDGRRMGIDDIPLPLILENDNWKMTYASLQALMDHS